MSKILSNLFFRKLNFSRKIGPEINNNISDCTYYYLLKFLNDLHSIKPIVGNVFNFSDLICKTIPGIYDRKGKSLYDIYEYKFQYGVGNDHNEHIERFKKFDVNNLPLIEVAKYLKIKVEKSNKIKAYGLYNVFKNKIILRSDYFPIFIHELVHAIDRIIGISYNELPINKFNDFQELVAELTTIVLCKTYNIQINYSHSMYYLNYHSYFEINKDDLIKRVSLIFEYIKKCIENIEKNTALNKR